MQIHYLPNIAYFQTLFKNEELVLHLNDTYSRRTFRNRTEIMGPNGKMIMTIPTVKLDSFEREYKNIRISYSESWLKQHWKSFESAYRRSIYFEYYEDKFRPMYDNPRFEYLWEFNFELMKIIVSTLKSNKNLVLNELEECPKESSYKLSFNKEYTQVFSNKYPFVPNLSVIDLIFNTGPQAIHYISI